jgi:putative ATP-binding cassette transporter
MLILPQRPYLPEGPLCEAIAYPHAVPVSERSRIAALLKRVGLGALADRLDERANWQQRLSLGEQQRLSIVRAVLLAPDWLFLDEATASLDEPGESMVYDLLKDELPRASIVSVGHRSTLRTFHKRCISLGAGRFCGAELASEPQVHGRENGVTRSAAA